MKLLRLHARTPHPSIPATAVTIGNFDGIHLGHQAMIRQLKQVAAANQLKSLVLIFEPQPLEFFLGDEAPPRISSLREKVELLSDLGVDYVAVAKFDHAFRSMSADDFAQLLKKQLNASSLVLGDDFHFGKNRCGDSDFLRRAGFDVVNLETISLAQQRVSSTRIRQELQQGHLALVSQLLGRPYSISGRVLHGDKLGRTIDFPTINVALHRHRPCLHGIYAVQVECLQSHLVDQVKLANPEQSGIVGYSAQSLLGACNIGTRPVIQQDRPEWRLEVHFPELSANLYGLLMRVTFLHYLHAEKRYASLDDLKQGISEDVRQIREFRQKNTVFPF